MFCSKCGNKLEEGTKFCANCGTSISLESPVQQDNSNVLIPAKPVVQQIPVEKCDYDSNISVLFLISAILFTIGPMQNFLFYSIIHAEYSPITNVIYNLTHIASMIFGMIAIAKIRKIIGNTVVYIIIVLLCIVPLINLFYLSQNLKTFFGR
jgi:hypothetical protein